MTCQSWYHDCMAKYFDAHCHLPKVPYTGTVSAIFNSARIDDWLHIANVQWGAIGVHPWYIDNLPSDWIANMERILTDNADLMVGEIGLDSHHPELEKQIDVFTAQLDVAAHLSRLAHIHCVGAWDEMLGVFNARPSHKMPPRILFHSFSGPADQIKHVADKYNAYFSYGARALKTERGLARIKSTPLNRLLIESDSDNPESVIEITKLVATLLNIDITEFADIIYNNAIRMIGHGQTAQN